MERVLKGEVLKNGESNFLTHAVNNYQEHKKDKKVIWEIFNDLPGHCNSLLFFFHENTSRAIKKKLDAETKKEGGGKLLSGYSEENHKKMQKLIQTELKWERVLTLNAIKEFQKARRKYEKMAKNRSKSLNN